MKYRLVAGLIMFLCFGAMVACSNDNSVPPDDRDVSSEEESNIEEPEREQEEAEGEAVNKEVMDLYLYMADSDLQDLYRRPVESDDRLPGYMKLSPDSEERLELDGGVRFRGNSTRHLAKKPFNIRFEEEQPFLFGSDRMNLNAMFSDASQMRERVSWEMFAELGHPAPRSEYFDLYINDVFEGLYLHVERIDFDMVEANGLARDGTLVRDNLRSAKKDKGIEVNSTFAHDLENEVNEAVFLESVFDYRGNPNWAKLAELIHWVRSTPAGPEFAEGFDQYVEADQFIDWLALHFILGDRDSFGDDYWLYLEEGVPDAKWNIIPWDKDLTFGSTSRTGLGVANDFFSQELPLQAGWDNLLFEKLLETPELNERLEQRLLELMDDVLVRSFYEEKVQAIGERIEESVNVAPSDDAFVVNSQNHHGELGHFDANKEVLLDYIDVRYEFIRAQILEVGEEPLKATKVLEAGQTDPVFFTGTTGWTIGKFEPAAVDQAGDVTMTVDQEPAIAGIDRIFTVAAEGVEARGELTFYYRNDLGWPGPENWYEVDEPIGDQWSLTLAEYADGVISPIDSYVNPYSNKVTATVQIDGTKQYVITYAE